MSGKKWMIVFFMILLLCLFLVGGITVVVDPYFHFHGPLSFLRYPLYDQRYQNDGIMRHFSYDAIITGTSMTENFKASEFDALFDARSVKVPFEGASYKELNDHLASAARRNPELRMVLRSLDYSKLLDDPEEMSYDADSFPTYLYDDNPLNDVQYVFNKSVLLGADKEVLMATARGYSSTNFDKYSNWMSQYTFGREAVNASYHRPEQAQTVQEMTQEDFDRLSAQISRNVTDLAEAYPDIEFYLFFPPYSIYYWDSLQREGSLQKMLDAERFAIERMLPYPNIHLFSFSDAFDVVCDLENYKDIAHYGEKINSRILQWISRGEHLLQAENYREYCENVERFYSSYPYDGLFAG